MLIETKKHEKFPRTFIDLGGCYHCLSHVPVKEKYVYKWVDNKVTQYLNTAFLVSGALFIVFLFRQRININILKMCIIDRIDRIDSTDPIFIHGKNNIKHNSFMSNKRKKYFINNYNNLWKIKHNNTTVYLYLTKNYVI